MNSFLDVAVETARGAGAILLAEFARPVKISYKGEVDIVTQADKRSEEAIVSRLRTHFPKHAIVAEEGGGSESDSPFRWHVDPLDGTTNFAHGYPCFCVSLGLEEAGGADRGRDFPAGQRRAIHGCEGGGSISQPEEDRGVPN